MWFNASNRQDNDLYATRPHDVELLYRYDETIINGRIWECACGHGHIVNTLRELGAKDVYGSDLIDYGFGYDVSDFLADYNHTGEFDTIMTNPPYKYATKFILHALSQVKHGGRVIMLLPTTTMCGIDRYRKIFKNNNPKYIYVFVRNTHGLLVGEGDNRVSGSYFNHSWFIWEDGYIGDTTVRWLYDIEDQLQDEKTEERNRAREERARNRETTKCDTAHAARNRPKEETVCTGVRKRGNTFEARIKYNGKYINLGSYSTVDEAIAARKAGEKKYRS